jgi:hypothetical protein
MPRGRPGKDASALVDAEKASPSIVRRPAGNAVVIWLREESQAAMSMFVSGSPERFFYRFFTKLFSSFAWWLYYHLRFIARLRNTCFLKG